MVRNVRTCLRKDPMCLVPIPNEKALRKWLWAVGLCGMASVPGCPILQSFYRAFYRAGIPTTSAHMEHIFRNTGVLERMTGCCETPVSPEARASFYTAFGVTPDYQVALEEYYDSFSIQPSAIETRSGLVENQPPAFLRYL